MRELFGEIVRGGYLGRVHVGLDYFDASINRGGAWVKSGLARWRTRPR